MYTAIKALIKSRNELVDVLHEQNKECIAYIHANKPSNVGKILQDKHEFQEPMLKAIHEIDEALMVLEPMYEATLSDWEKELLGM